MTDHAHREDATPGPARPEGYEAAYHAALDWLTRMNVDLGTTLTAALVDAVLSAVPAAPDSRPSDVQLEQATKYLREFIQYEPGTTMRPQREKADSCLSFILAALRAAPLAAPRKLREVLRDLVDAVTAEVNEKGGGGYILARLSDARAALRAVASVPASSELEVKRFQEAAMRGLQALELYVGHEAAYSLIFQPQQGTPSPEGRAI